MAPVKYLIHETPNPKGDGKKRYHVRPEGGRTVKIDEVISEISAMSSFSSSDVKGLLEAFSHVLKFHLLQGHAVELEGIGVFNVSITCPKNIEDPSKINANNLKFKKVNFKSNIRLNDKLRHMKFERSTDDKNRRKYTEAERHKRILNFVNAEGSIQSSLCMGLNGCSRYVALKDLNALAYTGKLSRHGNKSSSIYMADR